MALSLRVGAEYTRKQIQGMLGLSDAQGGAWYTGLVEHDGEHFIFCAIGAAGRTGHDYQNHFVGDDLIWRGRTGSRRDQPSIQAILAPNAVVRVFYRENDRAPFTYAGQARAAKVRDTVPVEILWSFAGDPEVHYEVLPEEVLDGELVLEGAKKQITVNIYERDPNARRKCLAHWGTACVVCGFDFGVAYGELGEGFIHVHHLKPLGEIGQAYELDPVADLRPVCPNCHAMLHRRRPALSIDDLNVSRKSSG